MKFKDYLDIIGMKPVEWADKNGLSPSTIWRAYNGKGFPDPKTIKDIQKASNDAVKPDDWY